MMTPINDIPALTVMSFKLLASHTKIVDEKFSALDVELKMAATTTNMVKRDNFRNPERGVVRY